MATPDPIPNSAVKHFSPDDTPTLRRGKVGHRQNYALFLLFFCAKIEIANSSDNLKKWKREA